MYYKLSENYIVTEDGDGATVYGVCVFDNGTENPSISQEPTTECVCRIEDITFDREEMREYIALWNELQPTLSQLRFLIEDIIDPPLQE